jgi:hypothetical protein
MPIGPQLPFEDNQTLLDTDTIGTEIQAYHPNLDELSALTLTTAGKALLDDADAAAQRTTLGLGTLATQSGTFSGTSSGTNTGDQSIFSTIAVSGQSDVVADSTSDTLTLVAGTNITITTDASTDSITINSSGGGGGNSFETIAVAGQSDVVADSSTDTLTLVAGSNIIITTNAGTDSITIAATGTLGATLGDGDYGDITASSSGTVLTIDNGAVTLTKMADMATDSFLGRDTAGTGSPEVLSVATTKTLLGLTGTNSGDQTITLTGDVTGTGTGSFAATIANDAVTYAKIQNVSATDKLLGRSTAGSGDVEEITCTAAGRALLDDAAASDQRTTLGLGTIATQNSNSVTISGGSVTGITDLALADGGTGASTRLGALTNLGINFYTLTGDTASASTAHVDIPEFVFTAAANTKYIIEIFGWGTAGATTTGHSISVNIPDGTIYGSHDTSNGAMGGTVSDDTTQVNISAVQATTFPVSGRYLYTSGVSGGTVQLRWSSEVAATTSIKSGSVMRVTQVN